MVKIITTLDIKSGYWHIRINEEDKYKLAFLFDGKLYEWNVMPFGPTNAPSYFQYVMNMIFRDLEFVIVYIDDITIISNNFEDHKVHLNIVMDRINNYGIKLRLDKCSFCMSKVQYLGLAVDKYGLQVPQKYKQKLLNVPEPTSRKPLHRFLGMVQFIHKFIPNLYKSTQPLYDKLKKDVPWSWTKEDSERFEKIRKLISDAPFLHHPDINKPYVVICDASHNGMGALLAQYNDNKVLVPIEFGSKCFNNTQLNWHVSEKEIFSIIYFVEKWRPFLIGRRFIVRTDHKNLEKLFNDKLKFKQGKLYRWCVRLQDFDFETQYIPGKENQFCDYLSRDALPNVDVITPKNTKGIYINDIYTSYELH